MLYIIVSSIRVPHSTPALTKICIGDDNTLQSEFPMPSVALFTSQRIKTKKNTCFEISRGKTYPEACRKFKPTASN